jgi:mRNA interferase MazF
MERGDIYWVNLEATLGSEINKRRPCVVVGATPISQVRRTLVVVPLSTSAKVNPPLTIAVSCLGKQVTAVCDQIRAIDKRRMLQSAGKLSLEGMHVLDKALKQVLAL